VAKDRNAFNRSVRPLPESLNRLLITDPKQQIEWIEDPLARYLRPTLFDRVLWWISVAMFGVAAFIFSATLTVRMLQ
jgi:hypothetical protein